MADRRWTHVAKAVALWVITLLVVAGFLRAGIAKFSDTSGWARAFVHWGFPVWFRVLVGVMEVAGAVLLLIPRTAIHGAALIIVVMLGGVGTHLVHGEARHVMSEIVPITLTSIVAFARRRQAAAPQPASPVAA
jgi:putative oxidoreductase